MIHYPALQVPRWQLAREDQVQGPPEDLVHQGEERGRGGAAVQGGLCQVAVGQVNFKMCLPSAQVDDTKLHFLIPIKPYDDTSLAVPGALLRLQHTTNYNTAEAA